MKRTQLKDALRNIQKQSLLFLSIVAITMMGTAAYLSIHFSIMGMEKNASVQYNDLCFRDFEIVSTRLLSPADLEAVRILEGVALVEPVWQTSGMVNAGDQKGEINVISIAEATNHLLIVEGRSPSEPTECAVEKRLIDQFGWEIGDLIEIRNPDEDTPDYLLHHTFRITCIANHPEHINRVAPDMLYIMVPKEAFDMESLNQCSMKAEILLEKNKDLSLFSAEYQKLIAIMKGNLEALGLERASIRDEEVRESMLERLTESKRKLEEAEQKLDEGRQQLEEGEAALQEGQQTLEDKRRELTEAGDTLEEASQTLQEGKVQLEEARSQLLRGQAALLKANDALTYGKMVLADGERQLNGAINTGRRMIQDADISLPENISTEEIQQAILSGSLSVISDTANDSDMEKITDSINISYWQGQVQKLNSLKKQMEYGKIDLEKAEAKYHQGIEKYYAGIAEYTDGLKQYAEKLEEYTTGRQQYEESLLRIGEAEEEIQQKEKELEEGKEAYQERLAEYQDGQRALADAEAQIAALAPSQWILFRARDNTSFVWQNGTVVQTRQIELVYSTLFLIISILVIYSSIQKLVLEQRTLVGVGKALGLRSREILIKYLLFGMLGTTTGMILGTAIAYLVLEPLILTSSNLFLQFDISRPLFDLPTVLMMAAAVELIAFLSVFVGCFTLLRSPATTLMQTQVPRIGKGTAKRRRTIPLMIRMIPRGMWANPGRVLITIVSVAGCCSLVVMGFTMRNQIEGVLPHQYPGIADYDLEISFNGSEDARSSLEDVLREAGTEYLLLGSEAVTYGEEERSAATLIVGNLDAINNFYHLRDYHTGETLALDQDGIYIHLRLAETSHLRPGDGLMIAEGFDSPAGVRVGAIYDNYFGWNIFLSDAGYEAAFGKSFVKNTYYVRLEGADEKSLREQLTLVDGFEKAIAADSNKEIFTSVSSSMNMFVVLMIVLAAILAAFIMVSLTSSYLLQKNNEAVIMRINGFTVREVILYLMAEIIVDTILGILLGFLLGDTLSAYMLGQMEGEYFRFVRGLDLPALLYGAGITALFSFLVNAFCLRRLGKMSLSDLT